MSLQFYVHITVRAYTQHRDEDGVKVQYVRKSRIPALDLADANKLCHTINSITEEFGQADRHATVVVALHSSMGMTYISLQDAEYLASQLQSLTTTPKKPKFYSTRNGAGSEEPALISE